MNLPVIVLSAGGHARVLIETLRLTRAEVIAVVDADSEKHGTSVMGIEVTGPDDAVMERSPEGVLLANGLGSVSLPLKRREIFLRFKEAGYSFTTVVHPSAVVSPEATLKEGAQVMAGAVVQPEAVIGRNSIVNSGAVVDHDCTIGDHVHIAPGATLSGNVRVGESSHVGTGATVIQNIGIGARAIIGAGAVVTRDVPEGATALGVPAREAAR